MKQATVKLPSGEYNFMEVPKCEQVEVDYERLICHIGDAFIPKIMLIPPGSWQLLGADPTNLTEVEAGEIVERWDDGYQFKDYTYTSDHGETYYPFVRPLASLDSLAASLGIEKPFVVLKNIEK